MAYHVAHVQSDDVACPVVYVACGPASTPARRCIAPLLVPAVCDEGGENKKERLKLTSAQVASNWDIHVTLTVELRLP
jgi:hypothetical protein